MAFGMEIRQADGTLWMSPDVTPLNLIKKISQTFTASYPFTATTIATGVPSGNACMVFCKSTSGGGVAYTMDISGGYWVITVRGCSTENGGSGGSVPITFYVFANMVTTPSRYSLAYYDADGVMRWHAEMRPLEVFAQTPGGVPPRGKIEIGFNVAVCSVYSGTQMVLYQGGTPPLYTWMNFAYRAFGTNVVELPVAAWQENSSSAYKSFINGAIYYIKTDNYD